MPPEPPIRVLVVGATSAIATETARIYAAYGARLFLAARNTDRLEAVAADLRARGAAEVNTALLDAADHQRCEEVVDAAWTALGGLDVGHPAGLTTYGSPASAVRAVGHAVG